MTAAETHQETRLSARARVVLAMIEDCLDASKKRGCDYAWPSHIAIARKTRLSIRTVQRAIAELRDSGVIEVRRAKGEGARGNRYYLASGDPPNIADGDPPNGGSPLATVGDPPPATTLIVNLTPVTTAVAAAEKLLLEHGVEQPSAGDCARRDPEFVPHATAHWQAKQREKNPPGPGLLVSYCRDPVRYGFRKTDKGWKSPPRPATAPGDTKASCEAAERRVNVQRVQGDDEAARQAAAVAWGDTPMDERQAILRGINTRHRHLERDNPCEFARICRQWAKRLRDACDDLAKGQSRWDSLTHQQQAAAAVLADKWSLFSREPVLRLSTLLAAHDSLEKDSFTARANTGKQLTVG